MATEHNALLIDDDEVVQKLFTKIGARYGITMTVAASLEQIKTALENASSFNIFFVDLILPEITGWEIMKRLKSHPETAGKPVVVLTGAVLSVDEKKNILEQANAIFEKKSF